jgi:organic hydroperoxide reductase OsmC/OhrA
MTSSVVPFEVHAEGTGVAQTLTAGDHVFHTDAYPATRVLVGGAEGNANFDRVEVRATVETDAGEEQFARLVSETARRCPVSQLFTRSGFEFTNNWTRVPLGAAV